MFTFCTPFPSAHGKNVTHATVESAIAEKCDRCGRGVGVTSYPGGAELTRPSGTSCKRALRITSCLPDPGKGARE